METELALGESLLQSVNELAAKDPSQDLAEKKEAGMRGKPAGVVGGQSAGGNDAMDMGMDAVELWRGPGAGSRRSRFRVSGLLPGT